MKPQYQIYYTKQFDEEDNEMGDCFRACVASIIECDVEDVPHFVHEHEQGGRKYWEACNDWLFKKGWAFIVIQDPWRKIHSGYLGYWIGSFSEEDSEKGHSVVMYGEHIDFDPHPETNFSEKFDWITIGEIDTGFFIYKRNDLDG